VPESFALVAVVSAGHDGGKLIVDGGLAGRLSSLDGLGGGGEILALLEGLLEGSVGIGGVERLEGGTVGEFELLVERKADDPARASLSLASWLLAEIRLCCSLW
jgi:hypothetical protein